MLENQSTFRQTGGTMKTLSGIFKLVGLVTIAGLAVLAFRAFGQGPGQGKSYTERRLTLKFKDAAVKNEDNFKAMLCRLSEDQYKVHIKHSNNPPHHGEEEDVPPCSAATSSPSAKLEIETAKVTVSGTVKNATDGELTAIQVHATQNVTSNTKAEIQAVLDGLQ
jgi:hypothetical protein